MPYSFSKTFDAPFADAVERAKSALATRGFGVLTEIDVAGTMKAKLNVDMAPYRILGACSPKHAYAALQAEPRIGAMLPCNVIVRELAPGRVEVSAVDPIASMQAVDNPALGAVAHEVQDLLKAVIADL
jgi:uncharacterized protein (DUF302 family)